MSKNLVVYFSASGVTAGVARALAEAAGADLKEIIPAQIYTEADLDWKNPQSRSSVEMKDPAARPAIAGAAAVSGYDNIFLGFPIWWYREPSIIDTFLEQQDFSGKKILLFATSGGSTAFGSGTARVKSLAPGASVIEGPVLNIKALSSAPVATTVGAWLKSLKL